MEVICLFNGLGNQMSQYALYLSKRAENKKTYFSYNELSNNDHQGYELDKVFSIKKPLSSFIFYLLYRLLYAREKGLVSILKKGLNLLNIRGVTESVNYDFDCNILKSHKGLVFYYGGWHSEQYFEKYKLEIRRNFTFDASLLGNSSKQIYVDILKENSISVHIRKGDYLNQDNYETFGRVCTEFYYQKAIDLMVTKVPRDSIFFVFSNDFNWVKEHLNISNSVYVDCNIGTDSWMDMCLMSSCKHHIISNSTFSWWGAWLNKNDDKIVICPDEFIYNVQTKDIYPNSWLKISNK